MPVRRLLPALLLALGLCLLAPQATAAAAVPDDERILDFASRVVVDEDASLVVTETLRVAVAGRQIERGILRDFPTVYTDRYGRAVEVGFDVLAVSRDGRPEPFAVEPLANGERVRIGSPDVFLSPGVHTYQIVYRTTRQLGFFDRFDELYWNVTGNDWTFTIERAEAVVELPDDAPIVDHAAYTGPTGARGADYEVIAAEPGRIAFRTTRPLPPGTGFTVAVAWPKGYVAPPSRLDRLGWALVDNLLLIAAVAGVLAVAGYYVAAWWRIGRDPARGTIVPLFRPPAGLSPAAARFVARMDFDDRTFAVALLSLAVKRHLRIRDEDDHFVLERMSPPDRRGEPLSPGERAVKAALLPGDGGPPLALKRENHATIRRARDALRRALEREHEGALFVTNRGWFFAGAALSVAPLLAALNLFEDQLAIGGGVIMLGAPLSVLVVLGVLNTAFLRLLKAPTRAGRTLLDQLEGFRRYLDVAEEERLGVLHPPDRTPELFERYLPYALALEVEHAWSRKFAAVLAASAAAPGAAPDWYAGGRWNPSRPERFSRHLGRSFTSAVASSATAPGSTSGIGGGSSGGGGGGGGGSGW